MSLSINVVKLEPKGNHSGQCPYSTRYAFGVRYFHAIVPFARASY